MDVLAESDDRGNWIRREVHTACDSLPLYLQESRGGENLEELFSVAVLKLGDQQVVRATVMEYFPEAYIGGEIKYGESGEPTIACLVVEPDFDPTQLNSPLKRVTKYYGQNADGVIGDGDRDRIKFPEHWTEQAGHLVFEVDVRTKEGKWMHRNLTFPVRMTIEMLKNSGRKKLT